MATGLRKVNVASLIAVVVAVLVGCRGGDVGSAIEDLSSPSRETRIKASYALVMEGAAAVEPLIECAWTGSDSLQYISAQVLGRIGDDRALPVLKSLSGDSNEHVRRAALVALGSMADRETVDLLTTTLLQDSLSDLRAAAAGSLGDAGDTLAVPALVNALVDTAAAVRKQAVVALHRLWTPEAELAVARALLQDEEETIRFVAAQSLGQRQAVSARDPLRAALRDSSVWVRAAGARSLGMLGDGRVIEDLRLLLAGADGPDVDAAREALQKLRDPSPALSPEPDRW